jgi:hypothetical protein
VFADDSTQLVNAIDATVKLDNGTISIDGQSVTSSNLSFDISNTTESPNTVLDVYNSGGTSAIKIISIGGQNPYTDASGLALRSSYGGFVGSGSEVAPVAGDYAGFINGQVYDPTFGGGTNILTSQISFGVDVNAAVAPDTYPGAIEFSVNTNTGSSPNFEIMVYNGTGLGIKTDPVATLDVNGFMKLAPLAAAPATLVNGLIAIDDGTTNWSGHASGVQAVVAYINTGWVKLNN